MVIAAPVSVDSTDVNAGGVGVSSRVGGVALAVDVHQSAAVTRQTEIAEPTRAMIATHVLTHARIILQ